MLHTGNLSPQETNTSTARQLQILESQLPMDLAHFMKFELIRGAEDSAPVEKFSFRVVVAGFTEE